MLNFDPDDNKVNESALEEMVSVSLESLFSWQHPLIEMNCRSMCLCNIRFWNGHLEHFSVTRYAQLILAYLISQKPI